MDLLSIIVGASLPTLLLIAVLLKRRSTSCEAVAETEVEAETPQSTLSEDDPIAQALEQMTPSTTVRHSITNASSDTVRVFNTSDALLATVSHELKTPLNGILGIAQLLLEEQPDSPELIELEGCAQQMHAVLHTLTNLARIQSESDELPQYREWISLRDSLEQIKQEITYRAQTRKLTLRTVHEDKRVRLRSDSDHLETIIKSVLLGSIEAVNPDKERVQNAVLKIATSQVDGVTFIRIENPIESFNAQRNSTIEEVKKLANNDEGTRIEIEYLYLAVARALVEYYNGSIEIEALESGGCVTTIRFKMDTMLASTAVKQPIGGLRVTSGKSGSKTLNELPSPMRVIVAEDDQASRNLMHMLLEKMSVEIVECQNGEEVVLALQEDPKFDAILMDVDMPVMDGIAATQAIRSGAAGDEVKLMPIIAVTAFNVISDRSRFKKAGMGYYLPKPVGLRELRATLLDILKKNQPAP